MYLQEITAWVATYNRFWDHRLDALGAHLEATHGQDSTTYSHMPMEID